MTISRSVDFANRCMLACEVGLRPSFIVGRFCGVVVCRRALPISGCTRVSWATGTSRIA